MQRGLLSSGIGGAVANNNHRIQALRLGLRLRLTNVVGLSGAIEVRWMAVHARLFVAGALAVVGWGKAAGFNHRRHVNGGGSVRPQDDAVFVGLLGRLDWIRLVIGQRRQYEVTWTNGARKVTG